MSRISTAEAAGTAGAVGTASSLPPSTAASWGAWLLALSPLGYIAVVAANVATFAAAGVGLFADITPQIMAAILGGWIVLNILVTLAGGVCAAGVILVSRAVRGDSRARPFAIAAIAAALVSAVGAVVSAVIRIALASSFAGRADGRLGDESVYAASDVLGWTVAMAALYLSVALLCVALYRSGRHRTAAIIVGALSVVGAVAVAVGVPLPPFVVAFLCLALGIAVLLGMRRAADIGHTTAV